MALFAADWIEHGLTYARKRHIGPMCVGPRNAGGFYFHAKPYHIELSYGDVIAVLREKHVQFGHSICPVSAVNISLITAIYLVLLQAVP